ncbi:PEP-CTERM sorting domain-containing protein [Singulisphaera sp. PoT]|uniref:PEP-CTERM sorting domain-containing protein n=1 Tax=Singulisphaera sp. PoT TaxID=3411797 RepID=UPI003BF5DFA6
MNRTRLSALVLAVTLLSGLGMSSAEASPISYSTYYSEIDGTYGPYASPISFDGNSGTVFAPGSINLGTFNTALNLPDSANLTYSNTPFSIYVNFTTASGNSGIQINGLLNGTISGNSSSGLQATVASITDWGNLPFPLSNFHVNVPQTISPSGPAPLYAYISAVPEPSTLALCGTVLAGLAVRRLRRGRKVA